MYRKLLITGASVAAVLGFSTPAALAAASSPSATSVPAPGTAYGCVASGTRALVDTYTVKSNFQAFLNQHGGKCPAGFAVSLAPGTAYGCVNSARALVDVYTVKSNYDAFLSQHGGNCPSGFEVTLGPAPVYGCVTYNGRNFVDAYTAESSYQAFLAKNGNACPGGFEATIGTASAPPPPPPPSGSWNCTVAVTDTSGGCAYNDLHASSTQSEYVEQDEWAAGGTDLQQSVNANSGSDWQVLAKTTGNSGAVLSYPDVQDTIYPPAYKPVPLSDFTDIKSTYSTSMPSDVGTAGKDDDYEAAYDIWLGNPTEDSWTNDQEIMVWTDNHNQYPAGADTGKSWTDPTTGTAYEIWVDDGDPRSTTTSNGAGIITLVRKTNGQTGSVDLLDVYKGMQADGYVATSNVGIDQEDYGFEICDTSGVQEAFNVNGYTLNATGSGI